MSYPGTTERTNSVKAPSSDGDTRPGDLAVAEEDQRRSQLRARVRSLVGPLLVFAAFMGLWYSYAFYFLPPHRQFLVPAPHDVLRVMVAEDTGTPLLRAFWETVKVSMTGLVIAIVIGSLLAIMMSQARWVEQALYPYAILLQVMPILAIVPLIGLSFGFNFKSRVIVCTIIALFPIITNTLFGLKSVESGMHDLFTLHESSRWQRFWKLQFRAAQPAIFTGLRISGGLSVIGAIVGDFFFRQGRAGLGVLLDRYRAQLRTEELYGAMIYAAILGLTVFLFFGTLAKRIVGHWHESYSSDEPV